MDLVQFEIEMREAMADAAAAWSIPDDMFAFYEGACLELAKEQVAAEQARNRSWQPPEGWAMQHCSGVAVSFRQAVPSWALLPAHGGVS